MTGFSNSELISGFSSSPVSNRTITSAALKEEHGKQMSYMCVWLGILRVTVKGAGHEVVPCWFHMWPTAAWVTDPVQPIEPLWLEPRAQRVAQRASRFSLRKHPLFFPPHTHHQLPRTAGRELSL